MVLRKWYDNCSFYLDCNQEDRIMLERDIKKNKYDTPFLLPHEFLYLLCNHENRLDTITRIHNPELASVKQNIFNWEFANMERSNL